MAPLFSLFILSFSPPTSFFTFSVSSGRDGTIRNPTVSSRRVWFIGVGLCVLAWPNVRRHGLWRLNWIGSRWRREVKGERLE